ncbi:MAG: sugar-binding protein [Verrucomicrobiota bacterium]|nr:sugar-binding protein [Verrucomicrobiota bacterium]MDG1890482.1 sugar-binding protein [Verrucomicrobiota bacterium]
MKKLILLGILTASIAVGITACGPGGQSGDGKARFAFVTNMPASFWVIAQKGVEKAGEELDVNVSVDMPADGVSGQKRVLEDLLARGVNGIAVSVIDPANQTDILNKVASRTALITHDADAPDSDRKVYIGMDNYTAGRMCGELVRDAIPQGGKVMIFVGRIEQDNGRRRRQGVIDELLGRSHDPMRFDPPDARLSGNGYEILGTLTDQGDPIRAKANAEDTLSRHPDVHCMVGLFAYNPPAIIEALSQAGKINDVKIVAFDEADESLQGIIDGTVHGTIVQNPYMYGYKSIEILNALHQGDASVIPEDKFIDIPARFIRKDNVQAFWDDLKVKTGQGPAASE